MFSNIISAFLVDRCGRRLLLGISSVILSLTQLALGIYLYLEVFSQINFFFYINLDKYDGPIEKIFRCWRLLKKIVGSGWPGELSLGPCHHSASVQHILSSRLGLHPPSTRSWTDPHSYKDRSSCHMLNVGAVFAVLCSTGKHINIVVSEVHRQF